MKRFSALLLVVALVVVCSKQAQAQRYVTYYQPATVYYAPPVVSAPVPYTVASPVVVEAPQPVVVAPQPVVTYYRAPTVVYQPVARVQTRYRPILGGTVSRVRYDYAPVVVP